MLAVDKDQDLKVRRLAHAAIERLRRHVTKRQVTNYIVDQFTDEQFEEFIKKLEGEKDE